MTISRRETGYSERDLRIAIGLAAGHTNDQIAETLGVDRSTVFNRKAANKAWIEMVTGWVKAAISTSIAVATEKAEDRLKKMYEKANRNLDEFLDHDDDEYRWRATARVRDEMDGKPTQKIKQELTSTHKEELVLVAGDEFKELMQLMKGSTQLMGKAALPDPSILEAELVEDEAPVEP